MELLALMARGRPGINSKNAVSASLNRKNDMGEFPHGNSPTWKQSEEALGLLRTL